MSDAAIDRKMRPILDALDANNFKAAIRLANAALVKYPDHASFMSLKAHALKETDHIDEATAVCEAILKQSPTDEDVLRIMFGVFRAAYKWGHVTEAAQRACDVCPNDEGFHRTLFLAHLRDGDLAAAHQVALKLTRLANQSSSQEPAGGAAVRAPQYMWWVITTLMLQATLGPKPGSEKVMVREQCLKLAELMAEKQLATAGGTGPGDSLLLTLTILLEQGKVQEASEKVAAILAKNEGLSKQLMPVQACLKARIGDLEDAVGVAREALKLQNQEWTWGLLQFCLDCYLPSTSPGISSGSATSFGIPELDTPFGDPTWNLGASGAQLPDNFQEAEAVIQSLPLFVDPKAATSAIGSEERGAPSVQVTSKGRAMLLAQVELECRKHRHAERGLGKGTNGVKNGKTAECGETAEVGENGAHRGKSCRAEDAENEERGENGAHAAAGNGVNDGVGFSTRPLAEKILEYFVHMGHMPSCASDVRMYTALIQGADRTWLASKVHEAAVWPPDPTEGESPNAGVNALRAKVSAFQVENDLGLPHFSSGEEAEAHAAALVRVYRDSLPFVAGLDKKERGVADELLPLAANALVAGWRLQDGTPSPSLLLKAILALEAACVQRDVSAPMRMSLVGLYGVLGAADPLVRQCDILEIKHIMLDSIAGHLLLPLLMTGPHQSELDPLLGHMMDLYRRHAWDWADSVVMAFTKANYTKVVEMTKFTKRLECSYMRATARALQSLNCVRAAARKGPAAAQAAACEVVREVSSAEPNPMTDAGLESLFINCDLRLRPAWLPLEDCPLGLAGAAWWDRREPPDGYGRCWWSQPWAGKSSTPEADGYRSSCLRTLRRTWLILQLMEHVLAPAIKADNVEGLLLQLRESIGVRDPAVTAADMETSPLHRAIVLLELVIFDAACQIQARCTGEGSADDVSARLASLKAHLGVFTQRCNAALQQELTAGQGLLCGGAWVLIAHFAAETGLWLALLLQVWTQCLKPPKKPKAKKGQVMAAVDEAPNPNAGLRAIILELNTIFTTSLQSFLTTLPAEASPASEELLQRWTAASTEVDGHELWSWEENLSVEGVLKKLVTSQTEALLSIRGDLSRRLAEVSVLPSS